MRHVPTGLFPLDRNGAVLRPITVIAAVDWTSMNGKTYRIELTYCVP